MTHPSAPQDAPAEQDIKAQLIEAADSHPKFRQVAYSACSHISTLEHQLSTAADRIEQLEGCNAAQVADIMTDKQDKLLNRLRIHDSSRSSCFDSDLLCNEAAIRIEQLERQLAEAKQDAPDAERYRYICNMVSPEHIGDLWFDADSVDDISAAIDKLMAPAMQAKEQS